GEVVVLDASGKPSFQLLQNYKKTGQGDLIYYIFDVLYYDGYDLAKLPLLKRKEILKQILPAKIPNIKFSDYIEEKGIDFFRIAEEEGLEGIIAKRADSPYRTGVRGDD